jgi:hypothetical protein
MDAVTAFLNSETEGKEIYVELPDGYKGAGDAVALLLRALYGLKQSPRLWQETLSKELVKLGFHPMENDRSIYITELGIGGIIIITYVDDFLLIGPRINEINILKEKLSSIFSMKDLGPCETFLGIHLIRDQKNHLIHLV